MKSFVSGILDISLDYQQEYFKVATTSVYHAALKITIIVFLVSAHLVASSLEFYLIVIVLMDLMMTIQAVTIA